MGALNPQLLCPRQIKEGGSALMVSAFSALTNACAKRGRKEKGGWKKPLPPQTFYDHLLLASNQHFLACDHFFCASAGRCLTCNHLFLASAQRFLARNHLFFASGHNYLACDPLFLACDHLFLVSARHCELKGHWNGLAQYSYVKRLLWSPWWRLPGPACRRFTRDYH